MKPFRKKLVIFLVIGVLAVAFGSRRAEAREVEILMALDVSGSMKRTDPLRLLPKSAHIMVELLGEKDNLGILTFEEVTLTRLPRGPLTATQRRRGFQTLDRLRPRGLYTDLYQVLAAALKEFGPPGQARRALLLISDGQMDINPRKGNSKAFVQRVHQEIIPAYQKAHIPIYTVAFTSGSDQALLKSLAEGTGGRFLLIPAAREIHQAFTRFFEELKGPQTAPLLGNHFVIDPLVQEATLVATRSQQGKPVGLTTPKGQKLTPASQGIRWFAAPTFDMVTISKPETGKWTVSGHKEGEGKIILMTDLKLECPHLPQEAGADEALLAGALLTEKNRPVAAPEVLGQTSFTAELRKEKGQPVKLPLEAPPAGQKDLWPPGTRMAKFPAFTTPGVWHLKVQALGKTFQRERNISLKVAHPWYKAQPLTGDGPVQVEFLPGSDRKAAQLAGWISIRGLNGGVAGKFVEPPPGKSFRFALPPGLTGACLVNLELQGVTAAGRPLVLQLPSLGLNATPEGAGVAALGPKSATAAKGQGALKGELAAAPRRQWLWVAILVLAALVLAIVAYFFRPRVLGYRPQATAKDSAALEMSPEQRNLLLEAQVEPLQKEKAKLQADLEEARVQIGKLITAKEELEAKLGQPSREYQEKAKIIKELEVRLEEAEKEAKSVQEEYMALYARSQQEKQHLKKG